MRLAGGGLFLGRTMPGDASFKGDVCYEGTPVTMGLADWLRQSAALTRVIL